ncbi:MAG: xanthine dehydrogenase family protein subunit M, partial [Actinomycetia bacterium]|nr:xanthine dehydrogenase family protein subunit M [Actinomycetes bacterium]
MSCRYHQPNTAPEALQLLETSPEAKLTAGCTDLMVQTAKSRSVSPPAPLPMNRIEEL